MELQQIVALTVFLGVFIVISTNLIHRTIAVLLGIGVYALSGLFLPPGQKLLDGSRALLNPADWNLIIILFSMMILTGFLKKTGFFSYLAIRLAKMARGNPSVLFFTLFLSTAVFAAFFGSLAAVMLAVPVSILLAVELDLSPVPFLLAETAAASIGSLLCYMGEPPMLLVGSAFGLDYPTYLRVLTPYAGAALVLVALTGYFLFRGKLKATIERRARIMDFDENRSIQNPALLRKTLSVWILVLTGFVVGPWVSLGMSTTALCGAALLMLLAGPKQIDRYFAEVEWSFVFFIIALLALVGGMETSGLIKTAAQALNSWIPLDKTSAPLLILWGSGTLSAFTDNVPYTAALVPFIKNLAPLTGGAVLWVPLVLGVALGGLATSWGAAANSVVITMAGKSGFKIRFWDFTRYGLVFALLTLVVLSVLLVVFPVKP